MTIRPGAVRALLAVCLLAVLAVAAAGPAGAAVTAAAAPRLSTPPRHVVVIGISGLRWSDVSAARTPELWRLAGQGSVGSLVDYAVLPLTCPADGWLTLNSGARVRSGHGDSGCGAFPAVPQAVYGAAVPGLPALEAYNQRFHNDPDWGLLARATPGCATAVGPGAALALADRAGQVADYLPAPARITPAVLSRCPLTVVDLGGLGYAERARALASADEELARIAADLPAGSNLLVTAPGAATQPPHLQVAIVDGPGYRAGLLDAASTRQPGLVTLTDLTPTVLGWLGSAVPAAAVGAQLTRGDRGPLAATVRSLVHRDTAEQVWRDTHDEFFWAYALADAAVLAGIGLASWGAAEDRRRRRARGWRAAGVFAASVPAATFLAGLAPWPASAHPAASLYGTAVALAAVIGVAALTGPWRRDPLGPFGAVCLLTLGVLGVDAMTGSRLQLETPFGLSLLEAGRFYGIGNEALAIYGISGLVAAVWLALALLRRDTSSRASSRASSLAGSAASLRPASRRPAVLGVVIIAVFAVFASGWPGFGGKAGGTIAMVPCFGLLGAAVGAIRLTRRQAVLVAVSGLAVFAAFALIGYFGPATGKSDMAAFAGDALHGQAGGLLLRKVSSNVGSLSVSALSPLIPVVAAGTGLMLWRPAWFRLRTVTRAYAARPPTGPLIRPVMGVLWLMPVLGWLADDSGVIVPAAALPFALPLGIAILASVAYQDARAGGRGTTVAGTWATGRTRVSRS